MAEEDLLFGKNRHLFGGIEPSNMTGFSIFSKTGAVKLLVRLPKDTIIDGQTLCTVAGAVIRRRTDKCPVDEFDGDLVADVTISGTVTDTTADLTKTYYYSAFPYTTQGVYNRNPANRTKYTPTSSYYLYGYDLDTTNPDPDARVSYPKDVENELFEPAKMNFTGTTAEGTFSYGSWPSTPGEGFMPRPCILVSSDPNPSKDPIVYSVYNYLTPDDYTTYADGSKVSAIKSYGEQAMMEWPKIYTKREIVDGIYKFRCAPVKIDDSWECWCNYDYENNEIDHFYTSIYKRTFRFTKNTNSGSFNGLASVSEKNVENMHSPEIATGSSAYEYLNPHWGYTTTMYANVSNKTLTMEALSDHLLIQDLLIMMAKTTDLKSAYGDGWTETTESSVGELDKKGMFYGAPKFTGASTQTGRVKIFGMEDYWDSQYSRKLAGWINDHGIMKIKLTAGTKDGSTVTGYNVSGEGYLTLSDTYAGSGGYISECNVASYGRIPINYSGSKTTYECDYCSSANLDVYFAIIAGNLNGSENRGPFGVVLNKEQDYKSSSISAALSYKPLKQ